VTRVVSNFAQTSGVYRRRLGASEVGLIDGVGVVSKADQFCQYADEAMRWARQSKSEREKQALVFRRLTNIHA
jgi:hypothetical protein